jgi:protein-S-isoprenylcysteine O-methyltransferase Ste14
MRKVSAASGTALFFALAPGVVAGLVPWWLTGWRLRAAPGWWLPLRVVGALLTAGALVVLVAAFVRFVVEGLGTPAPLAPTERLVVGGLYRYVRNPMYVAVLGAILGQAMLLAQPALLVYGVLAGVAMIAFARWYEEPTLARRYGTSYDAYRAGVPGWWPRLRPWQPRSEDRG